MRKNTTERMFLRGKEQFEKESALLKEHLKIESQIQLVENEDRRRLQLISKQVGIKIPWVIPSQLIDFEPDSATEWQKKSDLLSFGTDAPMKDDNAVSVPTASSTGVFFLSNQLNQDLPLPEYL